MANDGWFRPSAPARPNAQYDAIDALVRQLTIELREAPASTTAAEQNRLRATARLIDDDLWRLRAFRRIDELASLVEAPELGRCSQYRQASEIAGRVLAGQGPAEERRADAERAIIAIGELVRRAPDEESLAILQINSTLARLVDQLSSTER